METTTPMTAADITTQMHDQCCAMLTDYPVSLLPESVALAYRDGRMSPADVSAAVLHLVVRYQAIKASRDRIAENLGKARARSLNKTLSHGGVR